MACEGSASSPAPATLPITAGGTLEVFWAGATGELLGQPGTAGVTAYDPWVHAYVIYRIITIFSNTKTATVIEKKDGANSRLHNVL